MNKTTLKQELLEALYAPYKNCALCPLAKAGRTNVVFGRGNPNASLLFIGEAPGRDEDAQGQPFVGRSGKLLKKTLDALNINESSVYITNIVKCRPPENRTPTPKEISTCMQILLDKQIKIIRPQIICTLGSSALNALTKTSNQITKIHGMLQPYEDLFILPTYHPAYILRNASQLPFFTADLKKAHELSLKNTN